MKYQAPFWICGNKLLNQTISLTYL